MWKNLALVFVTVWVAATVSWAQQPSALAAADVDKFNASFAAAWAKGDAQAVAGHYTQDAVRIGTSQDTQTGRAAIQKYFADTLSGPSKGSKILLKAVGTKMLSPDVAVVHGTFDITGPGARSGRFMNTLVRTPQSGWLVASSGVVLDKSTPQ
jgi:uncharacterized protein (TIGR02246 family)